MAERWGAGAIFPQTGMCLATLPPRSRRAGGGEERRAASITSTSRLHPHLGGGIRGGAQHDGAAGWEKRGRFPLV